MLRSILVGHVVKLLVRSTSTSWLNSIDSGWLSKPDDAFDTDYLLDNESSKYKSELRRRRYLYKIENKKEFKCQKKYAYSEEKDDKENKEDQVHNPKNIFMSDTSHFWPGIRTAI